MRLINYFMRPHRLVLSAAVIGAAIVANANEPLDSDQEVLFPDLQNAREAAGLPKQLLGTGDRTFKVLEFQNINGNDPFNEEQPVLNFNGQIVGSVADLLALINNDGGDDGGDDGNNIDCNGVSTLSGAFSANVQGIATDFANSSVDFDVETGECQARADTNGNLLLFDLPVLDQSTSPFNVGGNFFRLDLMNVFALFGGGFTLLNDPDVSAATLNSFGNFFFVGRKVFQVRHDASNRVFDIDISIDLVAGAVGVIQVTNLAGDLVDADAIVEPPVYRMTINSITEVGV